MSKIKRAIVIVLDGVGIGELPDADRFGDTGSDTLGNLAQAVGGLSLPNLEKMGLANIKPLHGMKSQNRPLANFGKMAQKAPGKDSTSGHWELAGLLPESVFPTYSNGFPPEVLKAFRETTGLAVIGNRTASGTEIIKELGMEHLRTGKPIVYTSADSVFQIAAHVDVIPLEKLYDICITARKILSGKHAVSRVIARPFTGDAPENFKRTTDRKDFSLKPAGVMIQNCCQVAGIPTVAIGKIDDLYAGVGWDIKLHSKGNEEGLNFLFQQIKMLEKGLIMINLVDFDMLWGHRNNPTGYYRELQKFDTRLQQILEMLLPGDLFMITADHGNDPTTPSTDHSREYVPLLVYGPGLKQSVNLGIRETFADAGSTVAEAFGLADCSLFGDSFWKNISGK
jgi:phosphopentomutase